MGAGEGGVGLRACLRIPQAGARLQSRL